MSACGGRGPEHLVLASASPRRQYLLRSAGIGFEVVVPHDDEPDRLPDEDCEEYARRAATAKAQAVALRMPGRPVLGADTVVVLEGEVLGKPADADEAERMLRRLSGRTHRVCTGVALARGGADGNVAVTSLVVVTEVTFRALGEGEIAAYVATGEPLDKAGAYGIQGLGGKLVAGYSGSFTNVVGLPMEAVERLLG